MSKEMLYSLIAFVVLCVGVALGYLAGMPEPQPGPDINPDCYVTLWPSPTDDGTYVVFPKMMSQKCVENLHEWAGEHFLLNGKLPGGACNADCYVTWWPDDGKHKFSSMKISDEQWCRDAQAGWVTGVDGYTCECELSVESMMRNLEDLEQGATGKGGKSNQPTRGTKREAP